MQRFRLACLKELGRLLTRVLVLLPLVGITLTAPAPALAEHAWVPRAPIPEPSGVEGHCAAAIGNKIYVAFGFAFGDSNRLRIYDIAKDVWTMGPPAPTQGRSEFYHGVEHNGKLYCVGGRPTTESWRFDPASNTWTPLAPTPDFRAGATAAVFGNNIYLLGGRDGFTPCSGVGKNTVLRYDIDKNVWAPAGTLTGGRSDSTAARVGRLIYLFGGCNGFATFYDGVEVYDPKTETATVLPIPMPGGPRANAQAAARGQAGHEIHVTGGRQNNSAQPPVAFNHIVFDVDKLVFRVGKPMPTHCPPGINRAEHEMVYQGGRLYALGGACPAFGLSRNNVDMLKLSP